MNNNYFDFMFWKKIDEDVKNQDFSDDEKEIDELNPFNYDSVNSDEENFQNEKEN